MASIAAERRDTSVRGLWGERENGKPELGLRRTRFLQEPVDLVLPEIVVVRVVEDAPPVQDAAVVRARVEEIERQEIRLRPSAAVS